MSLGKLLERTALLFFAFIHTSGWCAHALVILSLDGVGFSQLTTIDPVFVKTNKVQPITPPFPSTTFASHATLATGVEPHIHGIVENSFYDGDTLFDYDNSPRFLLSAPLWIQAQNWPSIHVETYQWPNSYGPWSGVSHQKFEATFNKLSFKEIADHTLNRLKAWDGKKNFLFMSWTPGLDGLGHQMGPLSGEVRAAWEDLKKNIQQLQESAASLNTTSKKITFLFVSDHGMAHVNRWVDMNAFFKHHGEDKMKFTVSGPIIHLYTQAPKSLLEDKSLSITWHPIKHSRQGQSFGELPPGSTFLKLPVAEGSCTLQNESQPWIKKCPTPLGTHGYAPEKDTNMRAVIWMSPNKNLKWPKHHHELIHFVWALLNQ